MQDRRKVPVLINRLLKNSFSVIPEVFIGNPVFVKSTAYGFPLSRE